MSSSARETEPQAVSPASRVTPSPAHRVLPTPPASRIAAISAEIPLEIHGSRKSKSDGHPIEAFHEETVTVILFPQGGIVRLAAEVSSGQMMAVTNLNTQRGMLCRVVNVRAYPSLKSYVELEFTQPASGFWGVNFPEEAAPCTVSPVPESQSAPESKPAVQSESESKPAEGSAIAAAETHTESLPIPHDMNSAEAVALEATVVHVSSDEPTAPQSPAPRKPKEAKTEDFWGKSFPAELIDSALTLAAESAASAAASPESLNEQALASAKRRPVSNLDAEPLELAIEDDEAWQKLLAQVPAQAKEPEPAPKPEISEENLQLEPAAPKLETPAPALELPRAAESPRASVRPEGFMSNSAEIPPPTEPAPSATLKELERLALEHLDSNQDQPHAPAPPKPQKRTGKPQQSTPPDKRVEMPHVQPRIAASAAPLHSFTTPSTSAPPIFPERKPDSARAASRGSAKSKDKAGFQDFLKDPEPRHAASRGNAPHSEMLSVSLMDPAPAPPPKTRSGMSGGLIAVLAVAMAAAAGGAYVIINMNRKVPAVVGRTPAEQPPLPPDNLRPNAHDAPADTTASPESSDPSSTAPKPETKLEVELTTAVTPPSKNGPSPADSPKPKTQPQPKPTSRHSAIPPLSLSAPVSGDDSLRPTNTEPPPSVQGGSAAEANNDLVGKLGANANVSIPRPAIVPPSESTSLPAGGKVKDPKLIWSVPPTYPVVAKQNNIQGDVRIEATINETGHVSRMKMISGPALLQQPAMDALRQWRYEPSMLDGKPVAVQLVVTVQFRR